MTAVDDFGVDTAGLTASDVLGYLDTRIRGNIQEFQLSQVWEAVMGSDSKPDLTAEILREIYLEIVMYQPDAVEGAVAAIAQFPRKLPSTWLNEMLSQQAGEFGISEMIVRDYVALGGDESFARKRRQSPTAFAVSAIWRNISQKRDPFAYLGAVYLVEAVVPIISRRVKDHLKDLLGGSNRGLEFVVNQALAETGQDREIRQMISDVLVMFPDRAESVLYGFEYLANVYPLPGWMAAYSRVLHRHESQRQTGSPPPADSV